MITKYPLSVLRVLCLSPWCLFVFSLSACGSGGGDHGESMPELFRAIHVATDVKSIDVTVDKDKIITQLPYGQASEYIDIVEGDKVSIKVKAKDEVAPSLDNEEKIETGMSYTYLVYSEAKVLGKELITDDLTDPDPGQGKIRFINGSETKAAIDIYVTTGTKSDNSVSKLTPLVDALAFKSASDYFSVDDGTYRIRVTEDASTSILEDVETLKVKQGQIRTIVFHEDESGGHPYKVKILEDQG